MADTTTPTTQGTPAHATSCSETVGHSSASKTSMATQRCTLLRAAAACSPWPSSSRYACVTAWPRTCTLKGAREHTQTADTPHARSSGG